MIKKIKRIAGVKLWRISISWYDLWNNCWIFEFAILKYNGYPAFAAVYEKERWWFWN